MKRRVIFPPTDYWTRPKENPMTNPDRQNPTDIRLAAAFTKHHRAGDTIGLQEIVRTTAETGRANLLLLSVLDLHRIYLLQTRTEAGVDYLSTYVQGIGDVKPTDDSAMDIHRACHVLDAYGRGDFDAINEVLRTARAENRCTQILLALMDLYIVAIPELSSIAGSQWLDAAVAASHTEERAEQQRQEESE